MGYELVIDLVDIPKGGDIIRNKIILPMLGFKALVLMNFPLGNSFIHLGEVL